MRSKLGMDVAEDVKVNTVESCDGGAGVVRVAYGSRREAEEESVGFPFVLVVLVRVLCCLCMRVYV
jgi:hypothetical protein